MARVISRVPVRGPRRKTTWGSITSSGFSVIGAGTSSILGSFSAAGLANLGPTTLIRIRGLFVVRSDQGVALEEAMGVLSTAVVSQAALDAGAASIPRPVDDSEWDGWMMWRPFVAPSASSVTVTGHDQVSFEIDSKAMRKLGDLDAVVLMIENESGAHGCSVAVFLWFLFLLH